MTRQRCFRDDDDDDDDDRRDNDEHAHRDDNDGSDHSDDHDSDEERSHSSGSYDDGEYDDDNTADDEQSRCSASSADDDGKRRGSSRDTATHSHRHSHSSRGELSQHVAAAVLAIAFAILTHAQLHGGVSSWKDAVIRDWHSLRRRARPSRDLRRVPRAASADDLAPAPSYSRATDAPPAPSPSMDGIPAEDRRRVVLAEAARGRDVAAAIGHEWARRFRRTAGLNFCGGDDRGDGDEDEGDVDGLIDMEFLLPLHPSVEVLHAYYLSDALALDSTAPYPDGGDSGGRFYREGRAPKRGLGTYGDDAILKDVDRLLQADVPADSNAAEALSLRFQIELRSIVERYLPAALVDRQHLCLLGQYAENRSSNRSLRGTTKVYHRPHVSTYFKDAWLPLARDESDDHDPLRPSSSSSSSRRRRRPAPDRKLPPASLTFTGFAAKFVNLSSRPVRLYWDDPRRTDADPSSASSLVGTIPPMNALGTATFPGHSFRVSPVYDAQHVLKRWTVTEDDPVLFHDPLEDLTSEEAKRERRDRWAKDGTWNATMAFYRDAWTVDGAFARDYLVETGTPWLAHFPLPYSTNDAFLGNVGAERRWNREGGAYEAGMPLWRADYLGQTHVASTSQPPFASLPDALPVLTRDDYRPDIIAARRAELRRFRTGIRSDANDAAANSETDHHHLHRLTLRVLSVAPRVLEIKKFLSPVEVRHLLRLATGSDAVVSPAERSTVSAAGGTRVRGAVLPEVRSSTGRWIHREQDAVVDAIFGRVADVLGVDERLMRDGRPERRRGTDGHDVDDENHYDDHERLPTHDRVVEAMQLLRYGPGERYEPHHDFTYPSVENRYQPRRFATVLMYLTGEGDVVDEEDDDLLGVRPKSSVSASSPTSSDAERSPLKGGETTFPRAITTQFHDGVKVQPQAGKAVLFYNVLPDGNMDDLSQHSGGMVESGVKYLANVWVWDPIIN
ncbi:hypothetical protein ACHAXS_008882 [Conticribra weissflogii]